MFMNDVLQEIWHLRYISRALRPPLSVLPHSVTSGTGKRLPFCPHHDAELDPMSPLHSVVSRRDNIAAPPLVKVGCYWVKPDD